MLQLSLLTKMDVNDIGLSIRIILVFFLCQGHGCPEGWDQSEITCYFFERMTHRTYEDAKRQCHELDAQLVVIHSKEEQVFLVDNILKDPCCDESVYYIGFDDIAVEESFEWIDGSPLDFQSWNPGEPDNGASSNTDDEENCAGLLSKDGGKWNDFDCRTSKFYICEKPIDLAMLSLAMLSETEVNANNVAEVSALLAEHTENTDSLSGDGLILIADTLENIVMVENESTEVTNSIVNVVSNILKSSEQNIVPNNLSNASTRIINLLEMQASFALDTNSEIMIVEPYVAVSGVQLDNASSTLGGIGFGIETSLDGRFDNTSTKLNRMNDVIPDGSEAYIYVPQLPYEEGKDSSQLKFIFIAYINDFLFPSNTTAQNNVSVGGIVISASVVGVNGTRNIQFEEPVVIETSLDPNVTSDRDLSSNKRDSCYHSTREDQQCVFWDFGNGDWSDEGCQYVGQNERIMCHCYHLTNFAVLVSYGEEPIFSKELDIFSTVGCAVSIGSLIITILVFLICKLLAKRSRIILIQLCTSLILLYATFLAGIDRTRPRLRCSIIAIILHYAVLSSMAWMVVEARFLYGKLVRVFDVESHHFVIKYSLAAWGLPFVIVGVSVIASFALDLCHYQNPDYCFAKPGPVVYYALLLPIGVSLLFNMVTFVAIIRSITRKRPSHSRTTSDHHEHITRVRQSLAISTVLGLTWVFGFLAIEKATLVFQILFCVFNSLQGFFIFILYCIMQPDVRNAIRALCANPSPGIADHQQDPQNTSGVESSYREPDERESPSLVLEVTGTAASSGMHPRGGFELTGLFQ